MAESDTLSESPPVQETPPVQDTPPAATQLPLWQELGYSDADTLKREHTSTRQRVTTATQEAERLQRELAEERQKRQEYEHRILQFATPQPQEKVYPSLQHAYEGYLDGDTTAIQRWEAQLQAQQQAKIQEALTSTLTTALRPTQYAEKLVGDFPDLGKTDSPLYRAVWDAYDRFIADPGNQLIYGELLQDPLAMKEAPAPDGLSRKPMNLRVAHVLASRMEADVAKQALAQARQEGRVEEAQRRSAAEGQPPGSGPQTPAEPDPWEVLTESERRGIEHLIASGVTPPGWPRVQDLSRRRQAFARHVVERRQKRLGAA